MNGTRHSDPANAATSTKIVPIGRIGDISASLKAEGKVVVLCHGCFDLLHVGHIKHFQTARGLGDVLVVSITADEFVNKGPGRPAFPSELRADMLAALSVVDYVVVVEDPSAEPIIKALKPSIYVKGNEYAEASKDITGKITGERELVQSFGGRIHFTDEPTFSSSNLLNRYFSLLDEPARAYLDKLRHSDWERRIAEYIERIGKMKIVMIGETIIDDYQYVAPMGKAAKENIIATLLQSDEFFAGGVIAAANHLAGLCPNIEVISILGDPAHGPNFEDFVREKLDKSIRFFPFYRPGGPTVQKTRFVEPTYVRKLFEVYRMDDKPLSPALQRDIRAAISDRIKDADLVVVSDFGHGFLDAETIELLQNNARFLAVNAQSNAANTGYNLVTKYRRADFICIDALEARLASHDKHAGLHQVVSEILPERIDCANFIVTHGRSGCYTYDRARNENAHVPAFRQGAVDTVGAGDALFVLSAPFVAVGAETELAGFVGNVAGGIKVDIVGHRRFISRLDLLRAIGTLLK